MIYNRLNCTTTFLANSTYLIILRRLKQESKARFRQRVCHYDQRNTICKASQTTDWTHNPHQTTIYLGSSTIKQFKIHGVQQQAKFNHYWKQATCPLVLPPTNLQLEGATRTIRSCKAGILLGLPAVIVRVACVCNAPCADGCACRIWALKQNLIAASKVQLIQK